MASSDILYVIYFCIEAAEPVIVFELCKLPTATINYISYDERSCLKQFSLKYHTVKKYTPSLHVISIFNSILLSGCMEFKVVKHFCDKVFNQSTSEDHIIVYRPLYILYKEF